ncbi:GntR family transcriptional regulator [Rhodococcus wratislaviensis]|uniref:Putative GntR family transcriptional regulator n=1 Tax=Rhodococcus wratislaviensis NBRC 100605 TaxID=1219028 RepID=X0R6F8_RHOWR|nr:FCD domain-containing protein [Rhodococcus wratislaviensis]GAF46520.1 putative GntR family transcriptional regulator [Rhodococcus wratislaviensis NBRC 100605]
MAERRGRQTRGNAVYDVLRAEILGGRRLPGDRLKFPELSASFDASVSVLREALTRLAAEGLVASEPHLGYAVPTLSANQLEELTDARLELEALVFSRSIQEGDLAWESRLVAAHHTLVGVPFLTAEDPVRITDEWAEAHAAFHCALLDGCTNRRLLQMATGLRDEAELYRRWSQPLGTEKDRDLVTEHRQLMEAALARDVPAATASLREHISHTTRLLLAATEAASAEVARQ